MPLLAGCLDDFLMNFKTHTGNITVTVTYFSAKSEKVHLCPGGQ